MTTGPTFGTPAAGDDFSQVYRRPSPAREARYRTELRKADAAIEAAATPAERAERLRERDDVWTSGAALRKGGMRP